MNYSFRKKNKTVKYVVIHYTGMKSINLAYQKLSNRKSNVSAHYLISAQGKIFNLLCYLRFQRYLIYRGQVHILPLVLLPLVNLKDLIRDI